MADDDSKNKSEKSDKQPAGERTNVAGKLAMAVVGGAVFYLIAVSLAFVAWLIWKGPTDADINKWKDIVGIMVPVFAAWVGTILAFYFTKENFEAANKSVREMVGRISATEKLVGISAKEAMIPRKSITDLTLTAAKPANSYTIEGDVLPKFQGKFTRLPVFQDNDTIACIVHESAAFKFLHKALKAKAGAPPVLDDLLTDSEFGPLVKTIAFVGEKASLKDARDAMKAKSGCQDVMVTANGKPDESVLGWITNADIAKQIDDE